MNLPNIYGQGAMFAFSGLDGETDYKNDFVGSLLADRLGVVFHLKVRRELCFELAHTVREIEYQVVANDIMDIRVVERSGKQHPLRLIFADAKTVAGRTTQAAMPVIRTESGAECSQEEDLWTQRCSGEYSALAVKRQGEEVLFAFSFSPESMEAAVKQAQKYLNARMEEMVSGKLAFFQKLPACPSADPLQEMAFYKAFSVLKSNIMTAEGQIKGLWTTPDRIPHKNMWLWDSVFHSIALAYISPQLAYRSIEAVLDAQHDDGFIPHMATPNGSSSITQPPLLAWGIWKVFEKTGDKAMLEKTYGKLKRYLEWNLTNRDRNSNYLCEWFIEGDPRCRSGESGMDNSPRFDNAKDMDAVDFSSFMANDIAALGKMARELKLDRDAKECEDIYRYIKENLNRILWDEKDGIYYDRDLNGEFNGVKASSSFIPLFAGLAEKEQAKKLVEHLMNPDEFRTPFPVPSVALNDPEYSTDMWRGSVWVNYNYMIILGLKKYGYDDLAAELARKTIEVMTYWYGQLGTIFEFYDSLDESAPSFLERKGKCTPPYDIRRKIFPIKDYGWSASLYIAILMEGLA